MHQIMKAAKQACRVFLATVFLVAAAQTTAHAQSANNSQYTMQEIVDAGHGFFGETSGGLAKVVERAFEGEHPVRIPVWPIKLIVFIGAVLMTIEYIVQLVAAIRSKITPDSIDEVAPVVDLVEQFADDPEPPRPAASAQSDRKDS